LQFFCTKKKTLQFFSKKKLYQTFVEKKGKTLSNHFGINGVLQRKPKKKQNIKTLIIKGTHKKWLKYEISQEMIFKILSISYQWQKKLNSIKIISNNLNPISYSKKKELNLITNWKIKKLFDFHLT